MHARVHTNVIKRTRLVKVKTCWLWLLINLPHHLEHITPPMGQDVKLDIAMEMLTLRQFYIKLPMSLSHQYVRKTWTFHGILSYFVYISSFYHSSSKCKSWLILHYLTLPSSSGTDTTQSYKLYMPIIKYLNMVHMYPQQYLSASDFLTQTSDAAGTYVRESQALSRLTIGPTLPEILKLGSSKTAEYVHAM